MTPLKNVLTTLQTSFTGFTLKVNRLERVSSDGLFTDVIILEHRRQKGIRYLLWYVEINVEKITHLTHLKETSEDFKLVTTNPYSYGYGRERILSLDFILGFIWRDYFVIDLNNLKSFNKFKKIYLRKLKYFFKHKNSIKSLLKFSISPYKLLFGRKKLGYSIVARFFLAAQISKHLDRHMLYTYYTIRTFIALMIDWIYCLGDIRYHKPIWDFYLKK